MKKSLVLADFAFLARKVNFTLWTAFVLCILTACGPAAENQDQTHETKASGDGAKRVVHNARIHTFDPGNTVITNGAMAIGADGRVISLGDSEPMLRLYADIKQVDLEGKNVIPGLIDSHGHLSGLALSYTRANLVGTTSKAEVMERLREFADGLPDGEWLLGRGWDQNDWAEQEFPSQKDLDAEFPDRPVWLRRIDGHAAWGNSVAMAQSDRDLSGDWQVKGGLIHRDNNGQPTGIFIDRAIGLVETVVPETSPDVLSSALDLATQTVTSLGITGIHDPGINREIIDLYRQKIDQGKFPVRVYGMADGVNETLDWLCAIGPLLSPDNQLIVRSVKLYGDGALGSRGAAMLEDYSDEAGNRGLLFLSDAELEAQIGKVMSCGLQVGVHAIGDAANHQVLDTYEELQPNYPDNPGRHRIEHAQILHADDIGRFAELGIIAALQPIHATSDMYWAVERVGEDRAAGAYAWRSLLDSGATLAFGSDFPVEEVNPMLGIYAAITRQDLEGQPENGWFPQERLDRAETLRAFTIDAAFAAFMEQDTGSLEVGKLADFIVLDRDIMEVPAEQIPHVRVLQTWLGGEPVFKLNSSSGGGKQ